MGGYALVVAIGAAVSVLAFVVTSHTGRVESHLVEHFDRQVNQLKGFTMSANQDVINAVVAQLGKAKLEIIAKIADVQDQLDSADRPEDVDLSALTAAAQALDDIVPDAPVADQVEEPALDGGEDAVDGES